MDKKKMALIGGFAETVCVAYAGKDTNFVTGIAQAVAGLIRAILGM